MQVDSCPYIPVLPRKNRCSCELLPVNISCLETYPLYQEPDDGLASPTVWGLPAVERAAGAAMKTAVRAQDP